MVELHKPCFLVKNIEKYHAILDPRSQEHFGFMTIYCIVELLMWIHGSIIAPEPPLSVHNYLLHTLTSNSC